MAKIRRHEKAPQEAMNRGCFIRNLCLDKIRTIQRFFCPADGFLKSRSRFSRRRRQRYSQLFAVIQIDPQGQDFGNGGCFTRSGASGNNGELFKT